MKDKLHTVCNPTNAYDPNPAPGGRDPNKPIYPLENSLRETLGQCNGGYTVGIFDCCREEYSSLSRGGADPPDEVNCDEKDYQNFILWFGCPAGSRVDAKSTIAKDFFIQLKANARPYDGRIVLPLDLMMWHPGNGGEMHQKIKHQLTLMHDNWESKGLPPKDYGEDGEEEIKIDKKAISTEMRIRMQSLYKKANQ